MPIGSPAVRPQHTEFGSAGLRVDTVTTVHTSYMTKKEEVHSDWYIVDAEAQIVGRLATQLATILMGKHKPTYTPHVESGDYVVVINAHKVRFGGASMAHPRHPYFTKKMVIKEYDRYTGYPGGRRVESALHLWERRPEMILREAVRRMLPKNKLGSVMLKKLKLYNGAEHPHQAQNPQELPEHLRG
jgi:large subunit ribosomal protein L13